MTVTQITVNKRRLTVFAVLFGALSLYWLFIIPPDLMEQAKPKHPAAVLFTDVIQIFLGIGIQRWTREKPKYERLRLWVYFYTLLMCSVLTVGLAAVLTGKF